MALGGGTVGGLPTQLTSFVGRASVLAEAGGLLARTRLLTLTGAGGSGKTRLSVELATRAVADFPDGVHFVSLAPVRDPDLVPASIALALGMDDAGGDRPLLEVLTDHLHHRRVLLVLDNFEHLTAAATAVATLLRGTQALRLLVTSRSPLHVSGEQEMEVPPLEVPDLEAPLQPAALRACEAVHLFAERAAAALPGFAVDDANAESVARIACRLDGLPLAIELAAARVKLLPPEAMLRRLERVLPLLVGGGRDLPQRHQTLRSTITWSYDLLGEDARRLLHACSAFRDGIALDRIERVFSEAGLAGGGDVLELLQELVDQSLLRRVEGPGAPRFTVLETIREFAAERLAGSSDEQRVGAAHAAAFLDLAEQAAPHLYGPAEKLWLDRLAAEHNNIRAALEWHRERSPAGALRLAVAVAQFWMMRGHFTEGRERLDALLDLASEATPTRVAALNSAAYLAMEQGDFDDATARLAESLPLARTLDDRLGESVALTWSARAKVAARRPHEARPDAAAALELAQELGDPVATARALMFSALAANFLGTLDEAASLFEQAVAAARGIGWQSMAARCTSLLGFVRLDQGDTSAAGEALRAALPASLDVGDRWSIPVNLSGFAGLAAATGRPRQALRLVGAARAYAEAYQSVMPGPLQARIAGLLAPALQALGTGAEAVVAEGRAMPFEAAVALAMHGGPGVGSPPSSGADHPLTRRETEVATLVAQGLSNRDIATRLFLSVRTVETHVDHILTKLGGNSRTQIVAWAFDHDLARRDA